MKSTKFVVLAVLAILLTRGAHSVLAADNFASATPLTGATATSTENNQTATLEAGEPFAIARSHWWKWTAPANGRVVADLVGSDSFSKSLHVYVAKGSPVQINSLALVNFTTSGPFGFPAVAGTVYYFQVFSNTSTGFGNVRVNVSLDVNTDINQLNVQGPGLYGNDFFSQRFVLSGLKASSVAYHYSATSEAGAMDTFAGNRSMWWSWTAPAHGRLLISRTGSDDFQSVMSIYLGTQLSNLQPIDQAVNRESMTLPVTKGQTYTIAMGAIYSNNWGTSVLTLDLATATDVNQLALRTAASTSNDLFANRVLLQGANVSAISYGWYATNEANEPASAGSGTVWWTYTAPAAATVSLSTAGSGTNFNKILTVWTGTELSGLTQVARSGTFSSLPTLSFNAVRNQTYQISLGSASSSPNLMGHVILTLAGPGGGQVDLPINGLSIDNAVRLRFPTAVGAGYRVQSSNNLQNWSNVGGVIFGDGSISESYQPIIGGSRLFRVVPQ